MISKFSDDCNEGIFFYNLHSEGAPRQEANLNFVYCLCKISWTPEYMNFYLDGVGYGSWDVTTDHLREFHQPFFPVLHIVVGGWHTSHMDCKSCESVLLRLPDVSIMSEAADNSFDGFIEITASYTVRYAVISIPVFVLP